MRLALELGKRQNPLVSNQFEIFSVEKKREKEETEGSCISLMPWFYLLCSALFFRLNILSPLKNILTGPDSRGMFMHSFYNIKHGLRYLDIPNILDTDTKFRKIYPSTNISGFFYRYFTDFFIFFLYFNQYFLIFYWCFTDFLLLNK